MNVELANYLMGLDKYIVENDQVLHNYSLEIKFPMSFRLLLVTPDDPDQSLFVNIRESEKTSLKISLHHQDNNTQNGILRIDYNGRHLNPVEVLPTLPEIFKPFAGQWLDDYPSHIHYVVDGYKPLAWAIPLKFDEFPVKTLEGQDEYTKMLEAFFGKINLKTKITFHHQMRII